MVQGYEQIASETVFRGRIFDVVDDTVRLPTGSETHRLTVTHPGAVVIIPQMQDGTLLLIRQYRHSVRSMLLEFPAGTLEINELPLACAKREICEEVGYSASDWIELGTQYPAPGFCSEVQFGFLARELIPHREQGDEDEIIEIQPMSVAELDQAISDGEMQDAKSMALYARAKSRGLL